MRSALGKRVVPGTLLLSAINYVDLLKQIETIQQDFTKKAAVFAVGDKDAIANDERSQQAVHNALSSAQAAWHQQNELLRLRFAYDCLGLLRSTVRHTGELVGIKEMPKSSVSNLKDISLSELLGGQKLQKAFEASLTTPLASSEGCKHSVTKELDYDKVVREAFLRQLDQQAETAELMYKAHIGTIDFADKRYEEYLNLYADVWTNYNTPW